ARVAQELAWRLPTTLTLVGLALAFSIGIGIPAGLLSAAYRNSWIDHAARLLTLVSLSIPSFWLGLMLIILFSLKLDLLPIVGYQPLGARPGGVGGPPVPHPAKRRARQLPRRAPHPPHALQHARGAGAGVRPDRAGQGAPRPGGADAPRAPERPHPHRHRDRHQRRDPAGRERGDRDRLRAAGRRPARGPVALQPGPPRHPGADPVRRG